MTGADLAPGLSGVETLAAQATGNRHTFSTRDRAEAQEHVSRVLSAHRLELGESALPLEAAISVGRYGPVELLLMGYGADVMVARPPTDEYITVSLPLAGRIDGRHQRQDFTAQPDRTTLVLSTDSVHLHSAPGTRIVTLRADQDALAKRLSILVPGLEADGPLHFAPVAHSMVTRDIIVGTMQLLTHAPVSNGQAAGRIAQLLGEQALDAMLIALQHNHSARLADPAPRISSRAVADAVDRIAAETEATLTVGELAELAGVSLRALEAGFRSELKCTPLQHLHRTRLVKARDELMAAQPQTGVTVTDVATRWGFFHLGRFAAAFHREFGTNPSEALRRP